MALTHLVQVFLPLFDNAHDPFDRELFDTVGHELTERFGGLTAYTRAPAEGHWKYGPIEPSRDDIVIYEVMADHLDEAWWSSYRKSLEVRFRQQQVVVRAQTIRVL